MRRKLVVVAIAAGMLAGCLALAPAASGDPGDGEKRSEECDVVITGHRGASGYRPEHTSEAYAVAANLGADYIEADLVPTKDGELVARHESEISTTTDVAVHPEFAHRKTTKRIDGITYTGWFTEDFTLKELKTLRAKERMPDLRPTNTDYDGLYSLMTIDEVIRLARDLTNQNKREIGIYPELKHPNYFKSLGLPVEKLLATKLIGQQWADADDPVLIQSFEESALRQIDTFVNNRLVLLIEDAVPTTDQLTQYASWLYAVSYPKDLIIPRKGDGSLGEPTSIVDESHAAGLYVHSWTFRNENFFLPSNLRKGDYPPDWGKYEEEYRLFLETGIDALFSDFPDAAVDARERCGLRTRTADIAQRDVRA